MNHEQAEKLLGALIFDDLDETSKAQLLAYLETDEDLRESLADLRMALKVTTDAVQRGPDPVLSDTRLKRLERLSRSKGRPRVMLIMRWTAVAATIAIVAGAFLMPSLNQVRMSHLAATDDGRKHNVELRGTPLAYEAGSAIKDRPSRGSDRGGVTDGESDGDRLARGGLQVADNTWQMQGAANRPFASGLEAARQPESLGVLESKLNSNEDLGSFGNYPVAANADKFYAYSEAIEPRTSQPTDGVLSWRRSDRGRGEALNKRFLAETEGRPGGQSVDLYAMNDAKARPELDGPMAVESAGLDRPPAPSLPKRTVSSRASESGALGQKVQSRESRLRRGELPGDPHDGLPAISSMSGTGPVAQPEGPTSSVLEGFEGALALHERMPSKPEMSASRYGRNLRRAESQDRLSASQGVPQDRPEVKLADKQPEVASLKEGLRQLKSESGLGTDGWKAGRNAFGEDASLDYDVAANSSSATARTDLKFNAPGDSGLSETDAADSRHGFGIEAKAAEKVPALGDTPLFGDVPPAGGPFREARGSMGGGMMGGGGYGGQMPGGSMGGGMMGGSMGGGMMGGMGRGIMPTELQTQRAQALASEDASRPQQVLLETQVIKVDEGALEDLGFQKDMLSEQNGMTVWSSQNGKAGLDSVIDKLKQKDQLQVVATPSTMAQDGKEAQMSVMTEEYFMLPPVLELGSLGVAADESETHDAGLNMNLTPYVGDQDMITLDMDLQYTPMPQGTGSSIPEPPSVLSGSVSLEDGDSVILVNPEKKQRGQDQAHEAVILTAKLIQENAAHPAVPTSKAPSEFTLAPASRFKQMPVNPWVLSERDALSTFALDVDTASYALCRQYIEHGYLPPAGAVRMEEFVNAFDYAYPQRSEPTFSVMAEGTPSPFAEPGQALSLVKIAVKARTVGRDQRKAAHLVFVVDSSASMGQADRLPLIQQGLSRLVEELGPEDRVSLVSCSDQARLLLDRVPARDRDVVVRAVHAIQPSGSTNLLAGLQLGYGTAKTSYTAGQINQVILCSDGVANVGATEAESVLEAVAADRAQGIMLMCVGVGYGAYNDVLLEALANQGDGRYVFVDGADQVDRVFVQPLASALQTVAKDARIQVKFNPEVVRRYRLIGYENRDIKDEQFRDDTVDAGEVGSGQCATALYEIELTNNRSVRGDLGTVFVRYKDTDTQAFEEIARPLTGTLIRRRTVAQSPRFYLAASAARFAEWLRQSEHARATRLDQIQSIVDEISAALPLDQDIRELADLVRQAEGLPRAP